MTYKALHRSGMLVRKSKKVKGKVKGNKTGEFSVNKARSGKKHRLPGTHTGN